MIETIKLIEQWGYDKNIHLASPLMQTTKTQEEYIELQQAIITYEDECSPCRNCESAEEDISEDYGYVCHQTVECKYLTDIKDATGDIFVTLVMLSIQNKDLKIDYDGEDYTCLGYQEEVFVISNHISDMQVSIKYNEIVQYHINRIINSLRYIAKGYNFTLEECVKYAYNQIKDREGEMKNGLWVKE